MAERWQRSSQSLDTEDQPYGKELARFAKTHSSDVFYGCDEPLEAAVFSVFSEVQKELERIGRGKAGDCDVDP
jgi:hypothetical protein